MIVVIGHLSVAAEDRDRFVEMSQDAVRLAREDAHCAHFAVSVDPADERVNVAEVWDSRRSLDAFRGHGPPGTMNELVRAVEIAEYRVAD